jgi:site-specific DNA recombinase
MITKDLTQRQEKMSHTAWPAIVERDVFDQVQQRRKSSKENNRHVSGRSTRANYLLTGFMFCGVCGGKLTGFTKTSGKGYRKRYYTCCTHQIGHHDRCPKRYSVPAQVVEDHIVGLIRADLAKLRDDRILHQYIADELRRISGGNHDAREQLQRRISELDQRVTRLRAHLGSMDPNVAESVGLYQEAADLADARQDAERQLAAVSVPGPDDLPSMAELQARAAAAFDDLDAVIDGGTIEEKRELLGLYVQTIKADPDSCEVHIGLYPPLFSRKIVGAQPTSRCWNHEAYHRPARRTNSLKVSVFTADGPPTSVSCTRHVETKPARVNSANSATCARQSQSLII